MTCDAQGSCSPTPDCGFDASDFRSLASRLIPCSPLLVAADLKHRFFWWSNGDRSWACVPTDEYSALFNEMKAWRAIAPAAADALTIFLKSDKGDPRANHQLDRFMTIQKTFRSTLGYHSAWEGGWLYRSLLLDHRWLLRGFELPAFDEYIFAILVAAGWGGRPSEGDLPFLQQDPVIAAMPAMYDTVFPLSWKTGIILRLKEQHMFATVADVDHSVSLAAKEGLLTAGQATALYEHNGPLVGEPGRNTTEVINRLLISRKLDAPDLDKRAQPFVLSTLDALLQVSVPAGADA